MTPSHRLSLLLITIALVSVLCSCFSTPSQPHFVMSFLPAPLPVPVKAEPAPIPASLYADSTPNLVQKTLPAIDWPTEADSRIIRADQRFETGKKLLQAGDTAGARREFDRAVDILLNAPENLPNRQKLEPRLDQLVDTIYRYDQEGLGAGGKPEAVGYDK